MGVAARNTEEDRFGTSNCSGTTTSRESGARAPSSKAQSITAEMGRLGFSEEWDGCLLGQTSFSDDYHTLIVYSTEPLTLHSIFGE